MVKILKYIYPFTNIIKNKKVRMIILFFHFKRSKNIKIIGFSQIFFTLINTRKRKRDRKEGDRKFDFSKKTNKEKTAALLVAMRVPIWSLVL